MALPKVVRAVHGRGEALRRRPPPSGMPRNVVRLVSDPDYYATHRSVTECWAQGEGIRIRDVACGPQVGGRSPDRLWRASSCVG